MRPLSMMHWTSPYRDALPLDMFKLVQLGTPHNNIHPIQLTSGWVASCWNAFFLHFVFGRGEWTLKRWNNASEYHIRCTISLIKFQLWKWKWIEVQNELNPYEASSECATWIFADRFSLKSSNETDIRLSVKPYTPDSGYGQYFVPALCKSGHFFTDLTCAETDGETSLLSINYMYRRHH